MFVHENVNFSMTGKKKQGRTRILTILSPIPIFATNAGQVLSSEDSLKLYAIEAASIYLLPCLLQNQSI